MLILLFDQLQQAQIAREGNLLTRERLCCGLSLFGVVLQRLKGLLTGPAWQPPPPHHYPPNTDECTEFHR